MDFLDGLIAEEKALQTRLDLVRATLLAYGVSIETSQGRIAIPSIGKGVFPSKATIEKQLIWLFENQLTNGLKLKEVQQIYNELVGSDSKNIENTARRLKREGKLILVKYNRKHLHSYWGLPSWVEGNGFKNKHKPDMELLPEITSSEVVTK